VTTGKENVYGLFLKSLAEGRIDFANDTFKAMLVTDMYSPSLGGHQFKSSVTGEAVGTGYSPGGMELTIGSLIYSNKTIEIKAGNLVWPMVTLTDVRYVVIYDDSAPNDASKPLIMWIDFIAKLSPSSQSFYYNWPNGNLMKLEVP
jgi:hypothetical protein